MQFLCKKEEEKNNILTDYKMSYFLNFSLVLSANMYQLHLFTGKLSNNCTYIFQKELWNNGLLMMLEIDPPLFVTEANIRPEEEYENWTRWREWGKVKMRKL